MKVKNYKLQRRRKFVVTLGKTDFLRTFLVKKDYRWTWIWWNRAKRM